MNGTDSVRSNFWKEFCSVLGLDGPRSSGISLVGYGVVVTLSVFVHIGGAFVIKGFGLAGGVKEAAPTAVTVRLAPPTEAAPEVVLPAPSPPVATPVPLRDPPPDMPRTRKARARERQDSPQITPPTEIRGGVSESTRSPSEVAPTGPAVAEGNSSEVGVDPSKAGQPLPPVAAVGLGGEVDFEAIAVEDAFADTAADCSGALPQLDLTDDAINAGLTRGRLVFEVIIDQTGRVRSPRMIKGTGYEIDRVAREAISKIVCKPAKADGTAAVVRKELVFEVVDY